MSSVFRHNWLGPVAWITAAYVVLTVITFELLLPLQEKAAGDYANYASVIFLPHGLRVVVAWLWRWRSVPMMVPAIMLEHAFLYGGTEISLAHAAVSLGSILCAPAAFDLLALAGLDLRRQTGRRVHWHDLILVAALAAAINSAVTAAFYGNDLLTTSAWFVGDLAGAATVMVGLKLWFAIGRRCRQRRTLADR